MTIFSFFHRLFLIMGPSEEQGLTDEMSHQRIIANPGNEYCSLLFTIRLRLQPMIKGPVHNLKSIRKGWRGQHIIV